MRHIIFLVGILSFNSVAFGEPRLLDKIVAIVGTQMITLSDLNVFRKDTQTHNILKASGQLTEDDLKSNRALLDLMIREKILEQAVGRLELKATDDEIEVMINRIQKQNQLSRSQLRDALKAQGISYDTFRNNIKKQIEKQNLIQKEIQQKVQITEQDIYNYYLNHQSSGNSATVEYRISHILLLPKNHGGLKPTLSLASSIVKKLRGGAAFGELVKAHSEDPASSQVEGDLGSFSTDSLNKAFVKALHSMNPGDYSDPFISEGKVHILKLVDRRINNDSDFNQKKEQIRALLQKEEFDRQLELWFVNQKSEAHVKVML